MIDGILAALVWGGIGYLLIILPLAIVIGKCIKWGHGEDEAQTAPTPVKLRRKPPYDWKDIDGC